MSASAVEEIAQAIMQDRGGRSSTSSENGPASTSELSVPEGFVRHKVTKTDTLAGIAIKYRVTVSAIKRANGLLSDTEMWARGSVLVPTKELPIAEDAQVLFARLMSGYGRDASLNAAERKLPGTVAAVAASSVPDSGEGPPRSPQRAYGEAYDDDAPGSPYSRRSDRSSSEPGDVELMDRSGVGEYAAGSGSGYAGDKVRRRRRESDAAQRQGNGRLAVSSASSSMMGSVAEAFNWLAGSSGGAPVNGNGHPANGANGAHALVRHSFSNSESSDTWSSLTHLGTAITQSSLVQKIRRAASQPALASTSSLGDVADAMLRGGGGGSSSAHGDAGRSLPPVAPPRKDAKKD